MLTTQPNHQTNLPGVPVRARCSECENWMETSGEPVCSHCMSRRLLVELARETAAACETAKVAYAAHPNGAWGSMVARLQSRLCELAGEIAKEAGVER